MASTENGFQDTKEDTPAASTMLVKDDNQNKIFELKSPDLKDSEEIIVTISGNPTNFYFRLAKYDGDLEDFERKMTDIYNSEKMEELLENQIIENKVYAASDLDSNWHRVVITGSVCSSGENSRWSGVPVRFCDYGEAVFAPTSSLRELKSEFLKLPCMAMKGKLAGVRPVEGWSMDDCLRFADLVEGKLTVGTVVGTIDHANPLERTVYLNLVNPDTNVDIAQVLVSEHRALRDG